MGQTQFGVKGGLNLSDIVITNYINPDVESQFMIKPGFHAGVFLNSMVNEQFAMVAEVVYSNKGFRAYPSIHLHYITVPLIVQYRLTEKIFAEVGPEPGYLFSVRSTNGNESNIYNNKFDLSLVAGLRMDVLPSLFVTLRYGAGLFSVREPIENMGVSGMEKIRYQNRVLQLTIGYSFWSLQGEKNGG